MPTYDYQCRSCGTVTEVIHSMLEEGPSVCELCGGELRRVLHPAGIIFKGSGFYRTDSRKADGAKASTSSSAGGSDSKSTTAKPATSTSSDAPKDSGGSKGTST